MGENKNNDFTQMFSIYGGDDEEKSVPYPGQFFSSSKKESVTYRVHYGVFDIGPHGNSDLEKIMSDCANGKKLFGWERVNTTKDGDTQVIVKYLDIVRDTPESKEDE